MFINGIHSEVMNKSIFYASVTEFARYISNSAVFASKITECGKVIMDNNALEIGITHFA